MAIREFIPLFVPDINENDIDAVSAVLRTGMLVQGKNVQLLEEKICEITGAKNAVVVSNGTATLHLILHALGISKGDEVIIPAFSYVATANAIELVGATPVFADIESATSNINIARVEAKITNNTKAIMPVHEFGLSADLDPLRAIAEKHGLYLIEDAACALGSDYKGKASGSESFAASFSLHPRKAISSGEGGIVVTNDSILAERLRIFRNHGIRMVEGEMDFVAAGFNYRMTDFQAALVLNQTGRLKEQIQYKRKLANIYLQKLNTEFLDLPIVPEYAEHTWQTFHIILKNTAPRKEIIAALKSRGIGCSYGAQCIPAVTYYQNKYKLNCETKFPNALRSFHNGLALPLFSGLSEEEVNYIISTLNEILTQ